MTDGPRDLARHLPLSNRPRHDEREVGFDWRAELVALVAAVGSTPRSDAALARRRVRVEDFGAVYVDALEASRAGGRTPDARGEVTGAVALAQALRSSHAVRSVLRGRTVAATDAEWSFGSGPVLEGTATELILFLYGRAGVPGV